MRTIWKYELELRDYQEISMPLESRILDMQMQKGKPCIWVDCESTNEKITAFIYTVGTSHSLEHLPESTEHLGTYQLQNGDLVFHVYGA